LRGDVARVVAMALRREPDRRYASAEQLGADIANVVARRPVIARDTTLPYHIGRFVARNRIATALSATLLLAVIVAAAMAIDRARSAEAARAVAVTEARRAERVTEFLSGILRSPDPWTGDRDVMVGDVLDAAAERAGRDFGNDSATLGTIRLALAGSYRGLGRRTQAAAQYLAADSILASAGNSRGRIEARRGYAELQGDAGNLVSARAWYDSASQMASRSGDSLALAAVDADLAWLHVGQGALDSARVSGARALALRRRLGASAVDIANSLNNLAVVELEQGKPEDATRLLNEAVTLLRSAGSEGRAALGAALSTLGGLASDMGNRALADTQYRESLRLRRDVFGAGHPDEIGTLVNLAANALEDGRAAEALTLTDTILARIVPGGLPSEHPLVGAARTVRGRALVATGNLTAGTTELRNALALRRRTLPPGHPSLAYTLMALAEALDAGQHRAEAQAAAREAQRVLEAALGGEHPRTRAADALVRRLEANRNGAR
jgi:serine/threonine-protein kinase